MADWKTNLERAVRGAKAATPGVPRITRVQHAILVTTALGPYNFQPWRFIVVKGAATRSQLAKQAHSQSFVANPSYAPVWARVR